ncbi:hypothetical protein JAAARDRAFT_40362 [Jaapia argillacea MUCL 33604]|uniref:NAD-dependent epimerase/dehydratase domain-containing protein n=1 Tax=Jaapia argillacea MUCL 33604 TaxID=933084 RepID=A0A067PPJ1_9AGAM|nr:hypothetical protein JAAARDRAFT_40362 [Jaapia argillacea MUCL 33604]
MKVIVLGASGFIGLPIAQALVRAGHIVYGVTRSASKAKELAVEEIIPIVADVSDTQSWVHLVAGVDVVIDAVGGMEILALADKFLTGIRDAVKKHRPAGSPKLTFIYTSGTWVHGDNRKEIVSDTSPLTNPAALVSWRPEHEQRVIHDDILNGIVIRPSLLYGRSASILAPLFAGAAKGKVSWPGTPGGRYALIHADDLADLFVKVSEKAQLVGGQIFDAANDFTESVDDILQKVVEVSGAQGPYEYTKPANAFEIALSGTTLLRPYLARSLLGWQPKKAGLVDGLDIYYAAWKASQV